MTHYRVKIVCRAKSHAGKEVITGRLQSDDDRTGRVSGATVLIDNKPVDSRKVLGGINSPPDWGVAAEFRQSGRTRAEFECGLCGLRVELTEANATTLMRRLIASGSWTERHYRPDGEGDESKPLVFRQSSISLSEVFDDYPRVVTES